MTKLTVRPKPAASVEAHVVGTHSVHQMDLVDNKDAGVVG